jgi:hypothetical protein
MITYLLTLFLLGIMLVIAIGALVTYEITWWRYERKIRAIDKVLAEDEPDNPFALDKRL